MLSRTLLPLRRLADVDVEGGSLAGDLCVPPHARGVVLFAHGSGSSRHSPRNRAVALALEDAGFATLLVDLLTPAEELSDARGARLRFDVELQSERLVAAIDWLARDPATRALPIGLFGAGTGAAAAIVAAEERRVLVRAVVARGGHVDLERTRVERTSVPVLFVLAGADPLGAEPTTGGRDRFGPYESVVVPRATQLFEEPGALEHVARLASTWFTRHFPVSQRRGTTIATS